MDTIYLDNAATTKAHPNVVRRMMESFEKEYANPSALYAPGIATEKLVRGAKKTIADRIHAEADEIYFTSGGTEGDNFLIRGVVESQRADRMSKIRIITTEIEHPAVKEVFSMYRDFGIDVVFLPVDHQGIVDLDALKQAMTKDTILVSVMGVNNELGTVEPLEAIGKIVKDINPECFFHTDYVQGFMKIPLDVKKCRLDGVTMCAHKINGPKGVGAVYLRRGIRIKPLVLGGGQEKGYRSGTENVQSIVGFEEAVKVWSDPEVMKRIAGFRKYIADELTAIPGVIVNGPEDACPSVMSVSIDGIRGEVLLHSVEGRGVYISTGSACSSHKKEKNGVLKAIHLDRGYMEGTVRISFSALTTVEEVKKGAAIIKEEIIKLQKFMKRA